MSRTCARAVSSEVPGFRRASTLKKKPSAFDLLAHEKGHLLRTRRPERHLIQREQTGAARHHADDGVRAPVEDDRLAEDVGPRTEPALPEAVAQQDDVGAARPILVRGEPAAEHGLQPEQREVVVSGLHRRAAPARPRP